MMVMKTIQTPFVEAQFMKGPPDTPTIHLGVRRPEQALPKTWNICYNQGYGCAAHPTRHL